MTLAESASAPSYGLEHIRRHDGRASRMSVSQAIPVGRNYAPSVRTAPTAFV